MVKLVFVQTLVTSSCAAPITFPPQFPPVRRAEGRAGAAAAGGALGQSAGPVLQDEEASEEPHVRELERGPGPQGPVLGEGPPRAADRAPAATRRTPVTSV